MEKNNKEKIVGITEEEVNEAITQIAGNVFEIFKQEYPIDPRFYWLNTELLTCGIQNAATHINRAGSYHSDTGANRFKKAAYIGRAIAAIIPIQVARDYPINLTNNNYLAVARLNASFAIYAMQALLGKNRMYSRLVRDIRYCFQFRLRMDEDSLAMLLEHALRHSQNPKRFENGNHKTL